MINRIQFNAYKYPSIKNNLQVYPEQKSKDISYSINSNPLDSKYSKAYFINFCANPNKLKQAYSPVSSVVPDYSPVDCDYSDINEFCKLYSEKLNSQLMPISKKDIVSLVLRLQSRTKAPKQLILDVLYKLTYYSSYSNLDRIQEIVDKYNLYSFDIQRCTNPFNVSDSSANSMLEYIAYAKGQIDMKTGFSTQGELLDKEVSYGAILDSRLIDILKNNKKPTQTSSFRYFFSIDDIKRRIKDKSLIIFNLPGWDVKCSDGKYRSANLFYGTGQLEELAADVILRVQKGENLNEILYSGLDKKAEAIIGDNIGSVRIELPNKKADIDDIYNNLLVPTFEAKDIKNLVSTYFKNNPKDLSAEFLSFIDESTFVYSPDSMGLELRGLYNRINSQVSKKGYKKNDLVYVVPTDCKSFSYVVNMYAKINDISTKNIMLMTSNSLNDFSKNPKVILDDISASGETQHQCCRNLRNRFDNNNIIYSCIVQSQRAKRQEVDSASISSHVFQDLYTVGNNGLKIQLFDALKEFGYGCISSNAAFPYMIPDTNNDFSSTLFSKLLRNNNSRANKGHYKIG